MKSPLTLVKSLLAVAGVAALSAISAAPASAFSFSNIPGGATSGDALVSSLRLDINNQGPYVILKILNLGNAAASEMFIRQVVIHDINGILSSPSVNFGNVGPVAFSSSNGNGNLPQGGNSFTTAYSFTGDPGGANVNSIQAGETLGLRFIGNYNNAVTAYNIGALKVGIHLQGLPNGGSDSYISSGNTQDTPEPLTMLAAGAAVGFGTMFKKQRERAQKAE